MAVGTSGTISGLSLFTGVPVGVTIRMGLGDGMRGVFFRRVDLAGVDGQRLIAARVENVQGEARRTVLAADGSGPTLQTVEHLLSALAGLGIGDAVIDVDGPELPIGDGSAKLFVDALADAGMAGDGSEDAERAPTTVVVRDPIKIIEGGAELEALPLSASELAAAIEGRGPATIYSYHFDFSCFPIVAMRDEAMRRVPAQSASIALPLIATAESRAEYGREVAPARTFSLLEEAEAARSMGMFKHLTPREMLVIGPHGPVENAYRLANEPARHKLLDMMGDLSLCGHRIVGRIVGRRSGHTMNHELARRLSRLAAMATEQSI